MTYRSELYLIKSDNTEIPANIIANTLYLNKSYCEEEQLELGGCIPSQFKCSVYGIEDITDVVRLKYIRYSNNEPDISFEGIIAEITSTSNDGIYNITAYDELYNQTDISEWYNNYMANNQDVTISQLYSAVLEKLGLTSSRDISYYVTYDFVIKQNILSNNITGTRLLKWICEALGVFGILDTYTSTNETENGTRYTTMTTFSLNVLGPKPKTAISPITVFSGFQKSDYVCKKMDKVQIRSEEEDIGAIYGTGTNALIIEGNPLLYGMDASELEKCAKQISGNIKDNSDYTAYEAELAESDNYTNNVDIYQCYPISSSTSSIYSYIFNITWSGSQLTTCKIGANGVETRNEVLTTTNSELIKLNYKTTKINKTVDGIKTEVSSVSNKADKALTSIEQTAEYIENKVVKNDEVVAKINASQEGVSIEADKISLEGYTTINDNFKIDEKGNMETKNGKFSGEIKATSGKIGGFELTSNSFTATGQVYLPPTVDDYNKIRNALLGGTVASLYDENIWWDLNGDGKTDATDFVWFKRIMWNYNNYSDVPHKKKSDITIKISASDSGNKLIEISGYNAWGSKVDLYFGADSINHINGNFSRVIIDYVLYVGENTSNFWSPEEGMTVTNKIKSNDDIIAFSNKGTGGISLQYLKDDIIGGGSAYFENWKYNTTLIPANSNTIIASFTVKNTGTYMFIPSFRTTVPSGHIFSVCVFNYNTLQYPVNQFQNSCTMVGTGRKYCMNGVQIFTATAGSTYYVMGYATSQITIDSNNWFNVYCLKANREIY